MPSPWTAEVTSNSTTCRGSTAPVVATTGPSTTGRVAYIDAASDHTLLVRLRIVPPTLLPSPLPGPAVSRRTARSTPKGATPATANRRSAWRSGPAPASRAGALPNRALGFAAST